MDLSYTIRDAQRWATFSGDYNPIHFDLEQAKNLGIDGLSVHGMRALLDMKSHLSDGLLEHLPDSNYFAFVTRMRQPVFCGKAYRLTAIEPHFSKAQNALSGVSAKLIDTESGSLCFSSKLSAAEVLTIEASSETRAISTRQLAELGDSFPAAVFEPGQYWSFLDAVLFQRTIDAPEIMLTIKETLPELNAESLNGVFGQVSIVQTHHEVRFSRRLFTASPLTVPFGDLQYAIVPTLVMGNKESGFVIRVGVQSWTNEGPAMATAITLKTWPVTID